MSGSVCSVTFTVCLTMLGLYLAQADTLSGKSMEEDEEPHSAGPRNVLKSAVLPSQPTGMEKKLLKKQLDEKLVEGKAAANEEHEEQEGNSDEAQQIDIYNKMMQESGGHEEAESQHDENIGELDEEDQMKIYNKMKEEFGEDQMEVYTKMKQAQQQEEEEEAATTEEAESEAEAPAGPVYKTKMRMTLKGYMQERVEATSMTSTQVPSVEPKDETNIHVAKAEPPTKTEADKTESPTEEEENDEEHLKVFLPGQQAEWNNMIGTQGYQTEEKDWQLVNIMDKTEDTDGTTYGIQRGTLRVRVKPNQLRKPKKAAGKHANVEEDHREVDHSEAPQDLDHVNAMVPIAAPVGNRCLGKAKKLGKHWEETHKSPIKCRQWCELKTECHFISFSDVDGCNMYSKCKKTGGSGYRTWMKLRATPAEAEKARQAELLEDKYMELWSVSKSLQAVPSDGPSEVVKDKDLSLKIGSEDSIEISDVDLRQVSFSSWFVAQLFGAGYQVFGCLLVGAFIVALRLKMTAKMNMKAFKDGKALDNISAGGIVTWVQTESAAVISILQRMVSGADKKPEHPPASHSSHERYDMEMTYPVPQGDDANKQVRPSSPKLAQKAEESKDSLEPDDESETSKMALQESGVSEIEREEKEAEGSDSSIFKVSQGYHQRLHGAQPSKMNPKDEANASLKALMGASFKK